MKLALLALALWLTLAACAPDSIPTPTQIATPPSEVPFIESSPAAQALRVRAEAYALARTEARFDDAHAFTSPAFQAACDTDQWFIGLINEIGFTRAFAGLSDDEPVAWTVRLVEVNGDTATVLLIVATLAGRSLDLLTRTWTLIDGDWWFDDPPSEVCR